MATVEEETEDTTPRSGRRRRSGLSKLAERRGLIASPAGSSASVRDNESSPRESSPPPPAASLGLPPPAPKPRAKQQQQQQQQQQQRQQQQAPAPMERSRSSTDLRAAGLDKLNAWDAREPGRFESKLERKIEFSASLSNVDSVSNSSLASCSSMRKIPAQDARARSFLHGSLGAAAQLGGDQLTALIPDRQVEVLAVTWNAGGVAAKDYPETLESLLLPQELDNVPDIYSVSVQEAPGDVKEFLIRCQATIGPNHVLFEVCRNKSLVLAVFMRRDLIWFVSVPDTAAVSTRAALATKGCAALCFTLFGTSLLFLCCHFKHDANFDKRLNDFTKIITKLDLPKFTKPVCNSADVTQRFDFVIWSGDLNFRLRPEFGDRDRIDRLMGKGTSAPIELPVDARALADLVTAGDELKAAQAEGKMFQHFHEGDIAFPPTYKFDVGTDEYDSSEKRRVPAYTDRVLLRCRRVNTCSIKCYSSVRDLRSSDHRPVFALIQLTVRPGVDNIPLSHGQFKRQIYAEGVRRRATRLDIAAAMATKSPSQVCSVM